MWHSITPVKRVSLRVIRLRNEFSKRFFSRQFTLQHSLRTWRAVEQYLMGDVNEYEIVWCGRNAPCFIKIVCLCCVKRNDVWEIQRPKHATLCMKNPAPDRKCPVIQIMISRTFQVNLVILLFRYRTLNPLNLFLHKFANSNRGNIFRVEDQT